MLENYKITFLLPFISKSIPPYFPYFLNSCGYNPNYKFILFTNLAINAPGVSNVEIIKADPDFIHKLILKNTGINTDLSRFYKICDFKPAFGKIFQEFIKTPFWGHVDPDMILGDLSRFIDSQLSEYDVMSFRKEYHSGSFAVYRNNEQVNNLYTKANSFRKTLEIGKHFAFDEVSRFSQKSDNIYRYLINGGNIYNEPTEVESFTHLLKDKKRTGNLKIHFSTLIKEELADEETIHFRKGKLYSTMNGMSKEWMAYHFVIEKSLPAFEIPNWDELPHEYYISKYGFHRKRKVSFKEKARKHYKSVFSYYIKKVRQKLKGEVISSYEKI